MKNISKLLDEYDKLMSCDENIRRIELWSNPEEGIRWENQWHGLPAYTSEKGNPMPVTVECLNKIFEDLIGLDYRKYYTDPEYYLEYYLRMRLFKFKELNDDTPLTPDIPLVFGVTHEVGLLGKGIVFPDGEDPTFTKDSIVDENTCFPREIDFSNNSFLSMAIPFYKKMRELAGDEFRIIFPQWYRGPQGVALYLRGFQELSLDLYINEKFVHRLLRYVTDSAKVYSLWRQDFTNEPIQKGDLFNDDIPMMSPEMYNKFFFQYEKELSEFYGGIYYWHSCGDITSHINEIDKLPNIELLDLGVSMEDKNPGISSLSREQTIELRVMAQKHIQECSIEESREYIRSIISDCKQNKITSYVLRTSGMSIVHGAAEDLRLLQQWIEAVREVQSER